MMNVPTTPSEQFRLLFGSDFPGKIAVWSKQDKGTAFFGAGEMARAEKHILRRAATSDMYFGVCPVREDLSSGRGKADDVIASPGTWLDIDIGETGHKGKKYPPDRNTAWKIVREFPIRPSLMVNSGYGLHAYWLFDKLLILDTPEKRAKAASLSSEFQQKMRSLFTRHGFELDNTSDLARVLRIVGSLNHKTEKAKEVRVIYPQSKEEEQ